MSEIMCVKPSIAGPAQLCSIESFEQVQNESVAFPAFLVTCFSKRLKSLLVQEKQSFMHALLHYQLFLHPPLDLAVFVAHSHSDESGDDDSATQRPQPPTQLGPYALHHSTMRALPSNVEQLHMKIGSYKQAHAARSLARRSHSSDDLPASRRTVRFAATKVRADSPLTTSRALDSAMLPTDEPPTKPSTTDATTTTVGLDVTSAPPIRNRPRLSLLGGQKKAQSAPAPLPKLVRRKLLAQRRNSDQPLSPIVESARDKSESEQHVSSSAAAANDAVSLSMQQAKERTRAKALRVALFPKKRFAFRKQNSLSDSLSSSDITTQSGISTRQSSSQSIEVQHSTTKALNSPADKTLVARVVRPKRLVNPRWLPKHAAQMDEVESRLRKLRVNNVKREFYKLRLFDVQHARAQSSFNQTARPPKVKTARTLSQSDEEFSLVDWDRTHDSLVMKHPTRLSDSLPPLVKSATPSLSSVRDSNTVQLQSNDPQSTRDNSWASTAINSTTYVLAYYSGEQSSTVLTATSSDDSKVQIAKVYY